MEARKSEDTVEVIYECQGCGKEFKKCEFKMHLNPIEIETDEYFARLCPIEMEPTAFRRISPPRNRDGVANEHKTYRCTSCGWEGVKLIDGGCPECGGIPQ
jgi:ribosomal protein L37AE/L43A